MCVHADESKRTKSVTISVMQTKHLIYLGIFVGSTLGSWLGSAFDHGNFFGLWSILLGGVGAVIGVWAGYKIGNS